jgi:hypothetical protein
MKKIETEKNGEAGKAGKKWENRLRAKCDSLSTKKRFVLVISSLIVFTVMAVYMAVSSVFGNDKPEMTIKHIEGLKLQRANNDSINILKFSNHDDDEQ